METLMTVNDVAKTLKLSPRTIARLVKDDVIPTVRVRKAVRFIPKQVENALLEAQKGHDD